MDRIDIQAALTRNARQATQSSFSPTPQHLRMVTALWERMSQLYRNRWTAAEGPAILDGKPSQIFNLWLKKTAHLSTEDFARGMQRCEQLVQDAATNGGLAWPPTYAEFIGYCQPPKKESKPREQLVFARGLPEPKEHRANRNKKGIERCGAILDMLGE